MTRVLITLPDEHLDAIDQLARSQKRSRAAIIREALAAYLEHKPNDAFAAAFGSWKGEVDGLTYERRFREEW